MNDSRLLLSSPNWRSVSSKKMHIWQSVKIAGFEPQVGFGPRDLAAMKGNWVVIEKREDEIVMATDLPRSHPLSYAFINGAWVVSDDIEQLREEMTFAPNQPQIDAFGHTAIALGDETLVKGIHSTPAATLTRLFPDGTKTSEPIIDFRYSENPIEDPELFAEHFSKALDVTFGRLLENTGSRELVIPLSGGLDSRLIAVWLKKLNAPNITCFTYGKPDSTESRISRRVADYLGLKWIYIPMEPEEVRRAWNEHSDGFLRATWKGTSLPHVQDWFSLFKMSREGLISEDSIFLPGHTIVGNMHHEHLAQGKHSLEELAEALLQHNANMRGQWRKAGEIPVIRETIEAYLHIFDTTDSRYVQETLEWFNLNERQAKYINNSMSSYEYFGYSWALPMLEPEMWNVWLAGSPELTVTRDWYGRFVNKAFAAQTGKQVALFAVPSAKIPELPKRILLKILRATRASILLDRYRSTRTMLNHPMSFEVFTKIPKHKQQLQMMLGNTQLGLWTEEFLRNDWGGQGEIVPRAKS